MSTPEYLACHILPPDLKIKANESLEKTYRFMSNDIVWDRDGKAKTVDYIFNSPTQQYKVVLYAMKSAGDEGKFDLVFGLDQGTSFIDAYQMTGEGNVRTIIKTVASIIERFLNDWGYDKTVVIDATDEKRRRLYKELFPKYLPAKIMSNNIIIK
jgi:hypothetical protein